MASLEDSMAHRRAPGSIPRDETSRHGNARLLLNAMRGVLGNGDVTVDIPAAIGRVLADMTVAVLRGEQGKVVRVPAEPATPS